jgi:FixJ family two-component response regulator
MGEDKATVFVVDDDPSMRRSLESLLQSVGLSVRLFSSAPEFMRSVPHDGPGCIVLDVRLPGMSGLAFQQELAKAGVALPIIFVTGHGDIPKSVRAMKAGALDFLTKPPEPEALIAAVRGALERDLAARAAREAQTEVSVRIATLTPREREVLIHLVEGRLNKQIAADLGASEKTIKVHRARVLQKMAAQSIASLVRMTELVGLRATAK